MSYELTPQEKNTVEGNRKPDSDLPTYFNASLNKTIPISRDFETFLILASDKIKHQTISWLNNSVKLSKRNTDRDDLLDKLINNDASDASAKLDSINSELNGFNEFRESFSGDGKFNSVTEVGQVVTDLQRSVGELTMMQDRATHLVVLLNIAKSNLENNKNDEKIQEQLRSWSDPFSSY